MEDQIDPSRIRHSWDNRLEPTLRVFSGDVVHCDILMAGHRAATTGGPRRHRRPRATRRAARAGVAGAGSLKRALQAASVGTAIGRPHGWASSR